MDFDKFLVTYCENTECKDCPVNKNNYERRTELDKKNGHEPCVENLRKWITEQILAK